MSDNLAASEAAKKKVIALDGFTNLASRLGISPNSQNQLSRGFYSFTLTTRNKIQLEAAYRGSWVVGAVIDCIADDMTRAGVTITTNEGAQNIKKLQTSLNRLQIWQSIGDIIKWSRLYGGAIGVLQITGHDLSTPLNIESIGKNQFKGIGVYDRWQLNPDLTRVIQIGPEIGLPEYYDIVLGNTDAGTKSGSPTGQVRVHHSRCLRMIGIQLPFWQAITEMMWGESILERLWDRLISYDTTTLSSANLVERASNRVVKLKDFREIAAAGGQGIDGLMAMFSMIQQFQSNDGLTVLDMEDSFENHTYNFSGLSDLVMQFAQQVSGASGIPLIRLLGQSPAGLNSTGDADIRMYYDNVNQQQESRLRNPMQTILEVVYRSTFGVPLPFDTEFEFTPLWQMSSKDKAEIAKTNTETILAAHGSGLVDTATAMLELRDTQGDFGLFQNITDEMISEADAIPLPQDLKDEAPPSKAKDSILKRIFLR